MGLLHGAIMSIADVFIGIYDLIAMITKIIIKLIKGTLISDAKKLWEEIKQIKKEDILEMLGKKWNHPNVWDRWKFRGYVIGYAVVEILMLIFSFGAITAIKWVGKVGKFGKIVSYITKFKSIQKLINAASTLKGKQIEKIRKTLKAANALSKGHGWAAKVMKIPISILKRLREIDIKKLKQLPQWAKERFSKLSEKAMLRLLGCNSPCKVNAEAIETALKLATKTGKKLNTQTEVIDLLKKINKINKLKGGEKLNLTKISRYLKKKPALMTAIQKAGLTDTDFLKLADFLTPGDANPAQAYRTFTRYLTNVVPAKTGKDIRKLNEILAAIVKAETRRGSAMKGAMFEQWIVLNIAEIAGKQFEKYTFGVKKILGKLKPPWRRTVDFWDKSKRTVWEIKHTFSKVPDSQVQDYFKLMSKFDNNGIEYVKKVNYIFPSEEAALLNTHLKNTYRFGVAYIDEATNSLKWL